jgi:hypothetical protein
MKIPCIRTLAIAFLSLCFVSSANGESVTRFTVVDSSPTSWVARGYRDYTVSPELGWTFVPSRNFDNGIGFNISGTPLPGTTVDNWFLNFAAPHRMELAPGHYSDFQRWPFQDADRPGLEFGSTGRLDNRASGFFDILEVTYDSKGTVLTFAADFTHYGEENTNNYAVVELRFNASTVPEPSTLTLSVLGLIGIASLARFRRRAHLARFAD